eukprot:2111855-Prymnesium_polylepis.1
MVISSCCVMHSQHTSDCVLTIKRTESGRPNKHNDADPRERGLVGQWKVGLNSTRRFYRVAIGVAHSS